MTPKSILASKTFWFNAAALAILTAQWLLGHHWIAPADAAFVLGVSNIALRIVTNQAVTMPGAKMRCVALVAIAAAVSLAGCSQTIENTMRFHDGTTRDVVTIEQRPSMLNTVLVTGVEDPVGHSVETTVQGGVSPGKAVIDSAQTAAMLGMGALVGTGTNSVNLNAAVKP